MIIIGVENIVNLIENIQNALDAVSVFDFGGAFINDVLHILNLLCVYCSDVNGLFNGFNTLLGLSWRNILRGDRLSCFFNNEFGLSDE